MFEICPNDCMDRLFALLGMTAQLGHSSLDREIWAPEIGTLCLENFTLSTGSCTRSLKDPVLIRLWD